VSGFRNCSVRATLTGKVARAGRLSRGFASFEKFYIRCG
jgi:hypothetical protein